MGGEEDPDTRINALIEQSSLGSQGARRLRERITREEAESVVELASRLGPAVPSFPDFYRSQTRALVAFVMRLGAGAEEAADVAQETMAQAWQQWEEIAHHRAWVRTTAAREYLRRVAASRGEPATEIPGRLPNPGVAADGPALDLTSREKEVLRRIVAGQSTSQMSHEMNLATSTLRAHVGRVLTKLGVHSRLEAAALATRENLLSDPSVGEGVTSRPSPGLSPRRAQRWRW
jgi:DNA-binding NarL/FixJ family response regulator